MVPPRFQPLSPLASSAVACAIAVLHAVLTRLYTVHAAVEESYLRSMKALAFQTMFCDGQRGQPLYKIGVLVLPEEPGILGTAFPRCAYATALKFMLF
ncbi:hypothetical protein RB195_014326 [Necator americanus]|uniref:Secreted protein n=1 Tax=Necator americanus TaxID=51031 RepID=A0ABR1DZZ8_NECAM